VYFDNYPKEWDLSKLNNFIDFDKAYKGRGEDEIKAEEKTQENKDN
jgi:hypothetical protein